MNEYYITIINSYGNLIVTYTHIQSILPIKSIENHVFEMNVIVLNKNEM